MTTIQEALVSGLKNRLDEGRRASTKAAIIRDSAYSPEVVAGNSGGG
jgi:hypothetical protein